MVRSVLLRRVVMAFARRRRTGILPPTSDNFKNEPVKCTAASPL